MGFESFGLDAALVHGTKDLGYKDPTPIQEQAIPAVLGGRDVIGLAQTGTGKTAAFLLPILHQLMQGKGSVTRCLVLAPTRELVQQIESVCIGLTYRTALSMANVIGGADMSDQTRALKGGADIVIATPGRLLDHFYYGYPKVDQLQFLVLDEADRMLDMGFMPDIEKIVRRLPEKRQTLLFSATLPPAIEALAKTILVDPVLIEIGNRRAPAESVSQELFECDHRKKPWLLVDLLKQRGMESVLVFTATKLGANRLWAQLVRDRIKCAVIHGDREQSERFAALESFRHGDTPVLVATDIAARGLDVSGISHVVNFDVPRSAEDFIHRIGRTGRAGETGHAITLCAPDERPKLNLIERTLKIRIPRAESVASPKAPTVAPAYPETKPPEPRREAPRRDAPRRDAPRRDEPRRDAPRRDEPRRDAPRRDEPRRDEPRRDATRRDEPRRDEPRRDATRRDEPRRDEPRRDAPSRDEPRRDSRRSAETHARAPAGGRDAPRYEPSPRDESRTGPREGRATPRRDEPRPVEPRRSENDRPLRDAPRRSSEPAERAERGDLRRRSPEDETIDRAPRDRPASRRDRDEHDSHPVRRESPPRERLAERSADRNHSLREARPSRDRDDRDPRDEPAGRARESRDRHGAESRHDRAPARERPTAGDERPARASRENRRDSHDEPRRESRGDRVPTRGSHDRGAAPSDRARGEPRREPRRDDAPRGGARDAARHEPRRDDAPRGGARSGARGAARHEPRRDDAPRGGARRDSREGPRDPERRPSSRREQDRGPSRGRNSQRGNADRDPNAGKRGDPRVNPRSEGSSKFEDDPRFEFE